MRRKVPLLITAGIAAISLAACGGGAIGSGTSSPGPKASPQVTQPEKLLVQKVGFGENDSLGMRSAEAGALIHNPSTKNLAGQVTVQATAYGANGTVVGTGNDYLASVRANETLPVNVPIISPTGPIARVDVLASPSNWAPDPEPQAVTVDNIVVSGIVSGQLQATGVVHNPLNRDLHTVIVDAVCYDQSGNINGAAGGQVQLLPANGQAGVQLLGNAQAVPASCQAEGHF